MKFNIEKLENFTVMPTCHLQDKNLSLKAKGLLSTFYYLPNNWDYNINGLCKYTNTGITAIRNILSELELRGYLWREQVRDENGKYCFIYHIYFKKRKVKPIEDCLSLKRFKTALKHTQKK